MAQNADDFWTQVLEYLATYGLRRFAGNLADLLAECRRVDKTWERGSLEQLRQQLERIAR